MAPRRSFCLKNVTPIKVAWGNVEQMALRADHIFDGNLIPNFGGDDVRKFEPKTWLKFKDIDESIRELRTIYKVHPEWFETPKPKSEKGRNAVDYSI